MIPTLLILFAVAQVIHAFVGSRGPWVSEEDRTRAREVRWLAVAAFVLFVASAWFVSRMEWL